MSGFGESGCFWWMLILCDRYKFFGSGCQSGWGFVNLLESFAMFPVLSTSMSWI
jgi:hypothetical protein